MDEDLGPLKIGPCYIQGIVYRKKISCIVQLVQARNLYFLQRVYSRMIFLLCLSTFCVSCLMTCTWVAPTGREVLEKRQTKGCQPRPIPLFIPYVQYTVYVGQEMFINNFGCQHCVPVCIRVRLDLNLFRFGIQIRIGTEGSGFDRNFNLFIVAEKPKSNKGENQGLSETLALVSA